MNTRKILLGFVCLIMSMAAFSQSIVNPSFEDWNFDTLYREPSGYLTSNGMSIFVGGTSSVTRSTDSYSGQYAARLQTLGTASDTIMGLLMVGTPGQNFLDGGIPYSDKPTHIRVAVKYNLMAGDSANLAVFFKKNGNVAGIAFHKLYGVQNTWQVLTSPITWMLPPGTFPDSMMLLASSSNFDYPAIPGSFLMIDHLGFVDTTVAPIPNGGFEVWDDYITEEPVGWFTINPFLITAGTTSATRSMDAFHGSYALRLENKVVFDDTMGFLSNGPIGEELTTGGLGVLANPQKLTGFYKYFPVGTDTAMAALFAWGTNSSGERYLIDSIIIKLPPVSAYTPFVLELSYNGWPRVDTLNIIFSSGNLMSPLYPPQPGSALYLDSLNLSYYPLSIENSGLDQEFHVFPNPFSDILNIRWEGICSEMNVHLYDCSGRKIFAKSYQPNENTLQLNLSGISKGVYILETENRGKISRKQIIRH